MTMISNYRRGRLILLSVFVVAVVGLTAGCLRMKHRNPVDPWHVDNLGGGATPTPAPTSPPLLIDDCEDGDRWVSCSASGLWRTEVPFFSGTTVTPNAATPADAYMLGVGPTSALSLRAWGQLVCKYVPPPYFGYVLVIAEPRTYVYGYQRLTLNSRGSGDKPLDATVTLRFADGDQFNCSYVVPGTWTNIVLPFDGFAPTMVSVHDSPCEETTLLQEMIFSVSAVGAKDEVVNYDFYLDDIWLE